MPFIKPMSNIKVFGIYDAVKASKYPMAVSVDKCNKEITPTVNKLADSPIGSGHDQFLTGIVAQFDLTFSIKAWVEAERYHFLDFVSSQSTMHRIAKLPLDDQCNEYVDQGVLSVLRRKIEAWEMDKTPEKYLEVLYNVPTGFRLTARMTTNYRQLKTIYQQRKDHRLPEWREFCRQLEDLPDSRWITGGEA